MKKIVFCLIYFISITTCIAQTSNGFIEYEKVRNSISDYQDCALIILELESRYTDSIQTVLKKLMTKSSSKEQIVKTPAELKSREDSLIKAKNTVASLQKKALVEILGNANDCENLVKQKILKFADKFTTQNNISFLTYKSDILLCTGCKNYTEDLILFIKQNE